MQVKSYTRLSDEESIKLTIEEFEKTLKNTKLTETSQLEKLLKNYKQEEQTEILSIYDTIIEFSKK